MKKVNAQMVVNYGGKEFVRMDLYSILANAMAYGGMPPFKLDSVQVLVSVDGVESEVVIPDWAESYEAPPVNNPFNAISDKR